jgi:hypothetical protein
MWSTKPALLLLVTACTSSSIRTGTITTPPLGDTHVTHRVVALAGDDSPVMPQPSTEARRLRMATDQLIRDNELAPGRVSDALRALAGVLQRLAPDAELDIEQVDLAANQIEHADPDMIRRLRFGLDAARHALATTVVPAHADVARYQVEVAELRDESAKLTTDLSLAEQYAQVCTAFRAAVRAAFAADGAEAPTFVEAGTTALR